MTLAATPNVPAEWKPHRAMWTAWPSHPDLWLGDYQQARSEIAAMALALAKGERVKVLAFGDEPVAAAQAAFKGANVDVVPARFGDIWLRDTGPIFARDENGPVALTFRFNCWGEKHVDNWDGKYVLEDDAEVAAFIARASKTRAAPHDFVLEGGSLDFDGEGRVLTTKECLLNPNRNPGKSQQDVEAFLKTVFGVREIIWLEHGMVNDHTDGHIDNVARFVAPGRVVCPSPSGPGDPNAATYEANAATLTGCGLEIVKIPSPGLIADRQGQPIAASHMNFIIGNAVVVVPAYEEVYSQAAVEALQPLFPGREVVALPSLNVMAYGEGGGSFHCITQQEPEWE
ncbi:MAG: agmatine deiminase family protein [Alphaproteobacteria bacterium]|nr:agmatine deiminase family protein [Alphaproteobacteria bacterium]